jgi:hypothetical protein
METISDILSYLRTRLSEYRYVNRNEPDSVHINAIEIALCLTEYLVRKERKIEENEKNWFDAGWYMIQLFEGTQYEDLSKKYLELCEFLKKNDFKIVK